MSDGALLAALRPAVGERDVLTGRELCAGYETDWTGRFGAPARCVVRPGNTGEVAEVLAACAAHGVAVVPQGGNTGLVGGGVPRGGEVLLSLRRLTALGAVDGATGLVEAGAGVTLAALQRHLSSAGLDAGIDLGARDAATVGGLVACDAGGARAVRHGTARARVAGLEAVLAGGRVVRVMRGLEKDNAGLDLRALLVGSEGTLGVITSVLWRAVPRRDARATALVALASPEEAVGLLRVLRTQAPSLEACEVMTGEAMTLALEHLGRAPVLADAPLFVLVELADRSDPSPELAAALEAAGVREAAVAADASGRERLWALREVLTEALAAVGPPLKLDVGVPLGALGAFLAALPTAAEGGRPVVFGHLGDGNLHVNVLGAPSEEAAQDRVLDLVVGLGGTISAEHGVGVAKAHRLRAAVGDAEADAMLAVKAALDPAGLLNPGAGLPAA